MAALLIVMCTHGLAVVGSTLGSCRDFSVTAERVSLAETSTPGQGRRHRRRQQAQSQQGQIGNTQSFRLCFSSILSVCSELILPRHQ